MGEYGDIEVDVGMRNDRLYGTVLGGQMVELEPAANGSYRWTTGSSEGIIDGKTMTETVTGGAYSSLVGLATTWSKTQGD